MREPLFKGGGSCVTPLTVPDDEDFHFFHGVQNCSGVHRVALEAAEPITCRPLRIPPGRRKAGRQRRIARTDLNGCQNAGKLWERTGDG